MKNKARKYFIISSIIQIIIGILLIVFQKEISLYLKDILKEFPTSILDLFVMENIFLSGLTYLFFNFMILMVTFIKNQKGEREIIFFSSLMCLVTSISIINIILSIINLIMLKKCYADVKEEIKDKNLPKLKEIVISNKEIIMGTLLILSYMFIEYWWARIPVLFSFYIDQIILDILYLFACIFVFFKHIVRDFKAFLYHIKIYIKYIYKKILIVMLISIPISTIVLILSSNNMPVNQTSLEKLSLLYLIPSSIIWAPIVEEILFRGVLRKIFKRDILFIIISTISFGLLHTNWEPTLYLVFIQAIPYALSGFLMAYVYVKTDNIFTSIACHMFFNVIASLSIFI